LIDNKNTHSFLLAHTSSVFLMNDPRRVFKNKGQGSERTKA